MNRTTIGFPLGIAIGIIFGALIDNMGFGIIAGLLLGFGIIKFPQRQR